MLLSKSDFTIVRTCASQGERRSIGFAGPGRPSACGTWRRGFGESAEVDSICLSDRGIMVTMRT